MKLRFLAIAGLTIGIVTPGSAQVRFDACDGPQDACQQLADLETNWDAAFNKHDAAALAALYTPDAVIVGQGPILRGREAIEKWFTDAFENGWSSIVDGVDQAHATGDSAWWIGDWSAIGPGPNHSSQRIRASGEKCLCVMAAPGKSA